MKKALAKKVADVLRSEYDLLQLKGGVRGKYYRQAAAGTNLVLIEPELANVFPDTQSVNRVSAAAVGRYRRSRHRSVTPAAQDAEQAAQADRVTEEYLAARGRRGSRARFAAALAKVPKGEPEPADRLEDQSSRVRRPARR